MQSLKIKSADAKRFCTSVMAGAMLCFATGTVSASPLNITDIDGSWINALPGANITALSNVASPGTDSVRWGGTPGDLASGSGYDFMPAANLVPVTLNVPFALGTFSHLNQPISSGSSITDIEYAFQFSTNGIPANLTDTFEFRHNETPNSTGTSPADDDIVAISSVNLDQLITVNLNTFFFNLLGFSADGGVTISNVFSSPEGGNNSAVLYGIVTEERLNAVPEPGTLGLLLTGVLGLAVFRKKRSC